MQSVRVAHDLRVLTRKQAGHARAVQLHLVEPMSSYSDHPGVPGRLQGDEVRKTRSRGRIADSDERRIDGTRCRQRSAAAIAARNRDRRRRRHGARTSRRASHLWRGEMRVAPPTLRGGKNKGVPTISKKEGVPLLTLKRGCPG